MARCPTRVGVRAAHGAMRERGCTESRVPPYDYVGAAGGQMGARRRQDALVALLGGPAREALPTHAGDARSPSGRASEHAHAGVGAGVDAYDCADAGGCVRGYGCEDASPQLSLEVAVAAAALASRQGEPSEGRAGVVGAGEGVDESGGRNCRGCAHMTAVHVGDAPRDQ
jgi:hypothetical protein